MALTEITPVKDCLGGHCSAIFSTDEGSLVIIGKLMTDDQTNELLTNRVGKDEAAIVVPKELIAGLNL